MGVQVGGGHGQDSLYCPCSSHCFKLSPWGSPAFLDIPHIRSSTPHFTSSRGKTSQTGQVSESLSSTWQLCAVSQGGHSPHAAPEYMRQASAKAQCGNYTEDFKSCSENVTRLLLSICSDCNNKPSSIQLLTNF